LKLDFFLVSNIYIYKKRKRKKRGREGGKRVGEKRINERPKEYKTFCETRFFLSIPRPLPPFFSPQSHHHPSSSPSLLRLFLRRMEKGENIVKRFSTWKKKMGICKEQNFFCFIFEKMSPPTPR
jgi:hypothetical protein